MKRPTPKPLTGTERAELDKLIRRAAGAINSADGSRLVRLLDLDQADRAQERRTAGGMERTNRELTQRLKDTEARIGAMGHTVSLSLWVRGTGFTQSILDPLDTP